MNKAEQRRFDKLMQAAHDASFEAAEAMDRADVQGWTKLQERADTLRKMAAAIDVKKTPLRRTTQE